MKTDAAINALFLDLLFINVKLDHSTKFSFYNKSLKRYVLNKRGRQFSHHFTPVSLQQPSSLLAIFESAADGYFQMLYHLY